MADDRFDQLPLIQEEILLLSNHGETIEFPPKIAARLISVLATQLTATHLWRIYYEEKRESYCSMTKESFLDPETGPYKRLDNTAWYIKNKQGSIQYYLNMHTKFQQMPTACFKATTEGSPGIDVGIIQKDIAKFMEEQNDKK